MVGKKNKVRFLRHVAYFLRKYQGYTMDSVLNEYAIRFFALLNQSLMLDADEHRMQAYIVGLPNSQGGEYNRYMKQLERSSKDLFTEKVLGGENVVDYEKINKITKL
jgi:hypothetical protein